jgi:hypothetical protein
MTQLFKHYDTSKYDPDVSFELIPRGIHRLRVVEAEEAVSKRGNTMAIVTFSVSGYTSKLFYYFVDGEWFQRKIDPFFDSFSIQPGDFNLKNWFGKIGAAQVIHEEYQGKQQAKIHYFIKRDKQMDLPSWGLAAAGEQDQLNTPSGGYDGEFGGSYEGGGSGDPECPF